MICHEHNASTISEACAHKSLQDSEHAPSRLRCDCNIHARQRRRQPHLPGNRCSHRLRHWTVAHKIVAGRLTHRQNHGRHAASLPKIDNGIHHPGEQHSLVIEGTVDNLFRYQSSANVGNTSVPVYDVATYWWCLRSRVLCSSGCGEICLRMN